MSKEEEGNDRGRKKYGTRSKTGSSFQQQVGILSCIRNVPVV